MTIETERLSVRKRIQNERDKLFTVHNFQNSQHKFAKSLSSFSYGMHSAYTQFSNSFYIVILTHNSYWFTSLSTSSKHTHWPLMPSIAAIFFWFPCPHIQCDK